MRLLDYILAKLRFRRCKHVWSMQNGFDDGDYFEIEQCQRCGFYRADFLEGRKFSLFYARNTARLVTRFYPPKQDFVPTTKVGRLSFPKPSGDLTQVTED